MKNTPNGCVQVFIDTDLSLECENFFRNDTNVIQ
jgi:hypothetical protein